jgi:CRISPR/Cas system-associated exonuclease Cas4 (RecB family)
MDTLTHSSIQTFKDCRRKYYYRYVLGIEPKEKADYFILGVAVHLGLKLHYSGKSTVEIEEVISDYFQKQAPRQFNDPRVHQKWIDAHLLAVGMVNHYRETYQDEQFTVKDVEVPFSVDINGVNLKGVKDMIVTDEHGNDWVVEHKTTSSIDDRYIKKLSLDAQSITYLFDGKAIGVIYNVLLKKLPVIPKPLQNGKFSDKPGPNAWVTINSFLQACTEHKKDPNEYSEHIDWLRLHQRQFFYREWLTFPNRMINQNRDELLQVAWDVRDCMNNPQGQQRYYKNTSSCIGFGTCPFFDICIAPDKEAVIEASYNRLENKMQELEK